MCGRFTLHAKPEEVAAAFDVEVPSLQPRFNITPSLDIPVVRGVASERAWLLAKWGLIPSWSREPKGVANARAETVAGKPTFREAFRRGRCLIPADGFYEWKTEGRQKQPYYYRLRDGKVFAFAGLMDCWQGQETCTIITTEANDLVGEVHHRMPVILSGKDYDSWLDPRAEQSELLTLLQPYPAKAMDGFPVSKRVNKAGEEGPELIERWQDQPSLLE